MFDNFFKNKRIFLTGHTGFKGSWLTFWLHKMGAEICGYSLVPPTEPNLFDLCRLSGDIQSVSGDVRDLEKFKMTIDGFRPDIVFHLAAQSLVRRSYEEPVETYSTNVMGTVNLLEAVRKVDNVKAVINVTSDKCYENREWLWGYRENDPMGGYDPYSSSKGCAELVTSTYLNSYFNSDDYNTHGKGLASARAGNVIGGGDFADDRLVPDMMRAFGYGKTLHIRYPKAIRPWQHVLEPLSGYLILAKNLYEKGASYSGAWNFGPDENACLKVEEVVGEIIKLWGDKAAWTTNKKFHPHEAGLLRLDCSKARYRLGWKPKLDIRMALKWTVDWYKAFYNGSKNLREITEQQIKEYGRIAEEAA
jgi:CDP-glucose 4,6-dehydratase